MLSAAPDSATRDRVLREITQGGPITAGSIAERLGLTVPGIRRHLDALLAEGAITAAEQRVPAADGRRGPGRPARAYILTSAGHARVGGEYDDIATAALRFLAERQGPEAVIDFARARAAELEGRYAEIVEHAGDDPRARATALAEALAADGFAAGTRDVAGGGATSAGLQLCQGHCPMHQVATEFPQFCEAETEAFGRLLGVHVQRLATLAGGEHVCTTYVPTPAVRPDGAHGTVSNRAGSPAYQTRTSAHPSAAPSAHPGATSSARPGATRSKEKTS